MTLAEQMANVGSEVDRALRAHATQQPAALSRYFLAFAVLARRPTGS